MAKDGPTLVAIPTIAPSRRSGIVVWVVARDRVGIVNQAPMPVLVIPTLSREGCQWPVADFLGR